MQMKKIYKNYLKEITKYKVDPILAIIAMTLSTNIKHAVYLYILLLILIHIPILILINRKTK